MGVWTIIGNVFGAIWHAILIFLLFLWKYFVLWASLFIAPLKNLEMLWIIVPIYIAWILAEFFQEKRSTSFGNAISNGGVALWVGIDWIRYLTRMLGTGKLAWSWAVFFKFFVACIVFAYGITIIIHGIKGRKYIHFFGRIREVTYVMLMFTPIIYGIVAMDWHFFLAIILYFPLYYFVIEWIDRVIPDSTPIKEDNANGESSSTSSLSSFDTTSKGSAFDSFSSTNTQQFPPQTDKKSKNTDFSKDFKF